MVNLPLCITAVNNASPPALLISLPGWQCITANLIALLIGFPGEKLHQAVTLLSCRTDETSTQLYKIAAVMLSRFCGIYRRNPSGTLERVCTQFASLEDMLVPVGQLRQDWSAIRGATVC